jgi:CO/xanthine dehydrogenase Mo-binding subunit
MSALPPLPANLKANPRLDRWVRFDADRTVTVFSGKVELGQGIETVMAQIAAEELDVPLDRVALVAGDTAAGPNEGFTAGSQSIEQGGTALRAACAEVRKLFVEAAARRLEVSASELAVRDGTIEVAGTDLRTSYWELALDVSLARDATGEAALKPAASYSIRGTSVPRRDLPAKLTGAAYVHDLVLPGMVHARVLRPPTYSARLTAFDADAVRRSPGVVAVVVNGNFVAVCVEREEQAVKALEAARSAARWDAPAVMPEPVEIRELLTRLPTETKTVFTKGAAGAAAAKRLEATYSRPYLAHASIGPSCAAAVLEAGKLTVWTHAQGSFPLRGQIARVLGLRDDDVTVVHRDGAGCYGHNGADDAALDAALLARACGRPVLVQWTREDELAWSPFGSAMVVRLAAGIDADGKVVDWRHELWSHSHVRRPSAGDGVNLLAAWHLDPPFAASTPRDAPYPPGTGDRNSVPLYDFPAQEVLYHFVAETPLRVSALRSLGAYANVFAIESFMDELAAAANADPVAFRLKHLADPRAKAVIEAAAQAAAWQPGVASDGVHGRGIAFARYKNSSAYCAIVAEVEAAEKIRLRRAVAAVDAGGVINPDGLKNQVEGGIVQAASWTLKEAVRWDRSRVLTRSWEDYPILKFDETPAIDVVVLDQPGAPGLGAGECAAGPTAAAIANALHHALGVRARDLPLTPERVAAAMEAD